MSYLPAAQFRYDRIASTRRRSKRFNLALVYIARESFQSVLAYIKKAAGIEPEDAEVNYEYAVRLFKTGDQIAINTGFSGVWTIKKRNNRGK